MYSFRIIALGTQWKFLTVNNSQTVNIFFTCYSWQKNYLIAVINLERNLHIFPKLLVLFMYMFLFQNMYKLNHYASQFFSSYETYVI